jgi:large subunit ribosomal protein L14
VIIASVKQAVPKRRTVKKGDVVRAVVVRTNKELGRRDGSYIRVDENAGRLFDQQPGQTHALRASSARFARELRDRNYMKIVSLERRRWL